MNQRVELGRHYLIVVGPPRAGAVRVSCPYCGLRALPGRLELTDDERHARDLVELALCRFEDPTASGSSSWPRR